MVSSTVGKPAVVYATNTGLCSALAFAKVEFIFSAIANGLSEEGNKSDRCTTECSRSSTRNANPVMYSPTTVYIQADDGSLPGEEENYEVRHCRIWHNDV